MNDTTPKLATFDEKITIINTEIEKRRGKWRLFAIPWYDFDDVSAEIRHHIYKKWHLWNQDLPLEPWLNRVITHQIRNIMRNKYFGFARPCLRCPANQGNDLCSLTPSGEQCSECRLYKEWERHKKRALQVKLPLSIEHHSQEVYNMQGDFLNIPEMAQKLHAKMAGILKPLEWEVYKALYIDHKSEEEVALSMGYAPEAIRHQRDAGHKCVNHLKKTIINKVKKLLAKEGIE